MIAPRRSARRWLHTGAVSSTWFRGPATTYGARHVDEGHAVKRLLAENLTLEEIRARLTRLTDGELARFVHPEPVAKVGEAAVVEPPSSDAPGSAATIAAAAPASAPGDLDAGDAVEHWELVTLLPRLELLIRDDSGALVRRMAQEIQERYGAGKS